MVNLKSSVFLVVGTEQYLKDKAIGELKTSLMADASSALDCKVFSGPDTSAREILDYSATLPFLAERRLAIIREFEKLPAEDRTRLIEYIKNPPQSTCLVFDSGDPDTAAEFRRANPAVTVMRFTEPTDIELERWVAQFFSGRGKTITADALEILKELQGKNLRALEQELEKLAAFVGDRASIGLEDVEALVGKSAVSSAFDLLGAMNERNMDTAMRIVAELKAGGKRPHEIIGLLSWHFKRMLKAKSLQMEGSSNASIASAVRLRRDSAASFFLQLNALDMDGIKAKMETLLKADLDIKRTRFDPSLVLEFTVMRLCLGWR